MRATIILVTAFALAATGCATAPPNTPGAGRGDTYTPVVDTGGLDMGRYSADLDSCRNYARSIDAQNAELGGMIAGILVGALIGAAYRGNSRTINDSALIGGGAALATAGNRARNKQETITANCLAQRGYRVLDGVATVATATVASSPYTAVVQPTLYTPQTPDTARPVVTGGQELLQAERFAKAQACHASPQAALAAKGPGFETYSVACSSGDTMMVRCEFGNCRALK